jgi:hypothetical protein
MLDLHARLNSTRKTRGLTEFAGPAGLYNERLKNQIQIRLIRTAFCINSQ